MPNSMLTPLLLILGVLLSPARAAAVAPESLRCEYLKNPLGIDVTWPRLSWILVSDERGQYQSAYQVLVASSAEKLAAGRGDLWDSGRVESDESIHVEYSGKPLRSGQACYWKVRVWDRLGNGPVESAPARWEMGLLEAEQWEPAQWIAGEHLEEMSDDGGRGYRMPYLRRGFHIERPIARARLYVSSLGYHNVYLNGKKVGDHLFDPVQSDYADRVFYVTHDVTDVVQSGGNVLGAWLGTGWYIASDVERPRPGLLARLVIDHPDGSQRVVASDSQWKTGSSPLLIAGPVTGAGGRFGAERYDFRREQAGWNDAGFDDSVWRSAVELKDLTTRVLSAQFVPPNRVITRFEPAAVIERGGNEYLIDCGRNVVGLLRLTARDQQPGDELTLTYSPSHTGAPNRMDEVFGQVDRYVCAGREIEEVRPHLNWRTFRFVLVRGLRSKPRNGDIVAELVSTDTPTISSFECSDPVLNRLDQVVRYTHRCLTLGGIQVDCPHRERLGYGAEGQASMRQAMWNFDMAAFYTKWAWDFADGQDPETGATAYTAPFRVGSGGGPAWPGALILYPWQNYQFYGDTRLLERLHPYMARWIAYLESHADDGILERFAYRAPDNYWEFLGDWAPPKNEPHYAPDGKVDRWPCRWSTPEENQLFNTMSYAHQTRTLAEIAQVLGKRDAPRYAAAAGNIRQAVRQKWFDREKATFRSTGHPQTYLAFALLTGVVPCELRDRAMRGLEAEIVDRWQGHLDTGVLGSFYLIEQLLAQNRSDLIYRIAMQPQPPSWRAMLDQGATTIWEHWVPAWSSVHNSFLSIGGWFIPGIAGIRLQADSPGFRKVTIRPQPVGGITWAKAEYDSVRGRIAVHWRRQERAFEIDVALPPGTTATVYLPATEGAVLTESGLPLAATPGVKPLGREEGHALLQVECGNYSFSAK